MYFFYGIKYAMSPELTPSKICLKEGNVRLQESLQELDVALEVECTGTAPGLTRDHVAFVGIDKDSRQVIIYVPNKVAERYVSSLPRATPRHF
jgi:hypothetical protein